MNRGVKLSEGMAGIMTVISGMAFPFHHHEVGLCSGTAAVIFFVFGVIIHFTDKNNFRGTPASDESSQLSHSMPENMIPSAQREISKKLTRFTPKEIVFEVRKVKPFQKESVAKTFKDIPVSWVLTLTSLTISEDRVSFCLSDGSVGIFAVTSKAEVSHLAMLDKGAKLIVTGFINKVDSNWVDIRDPVIELAD